jgi:7-carboxy-7-deazaguanine synthase
VSSEIRIAGGTEYDLNDMYVSVQGEGCLTGMPMVVVRMMGCPVGCAFCDTKETWTALDEHRRQFVDFDVWKGATPEWTRTTAQQIARKAREIAGEWVNWIMLTGGEPAMQRLAALVAAFHAEQFSVALETSGTGDGHIGAGFDWVTVSPKIGMPGGRAIIAAALAPAHEIKFVIGKDTDVLKMGDFYHQYADIIGSEHPAVPAEKCVQPISQSAKATELCVKLALEKGYRLSIQVHKYVGLA